MKPKYQHDCEDCTFLGHFYDHDVYTCRKSVIARYGDQGSQYWSLPRHAFAQVMGSEQWAEDQHMRAMVAALCCHEIGELPDEMRQFSDIGEVKAAVYKLKWDMLFSPEKKDIVPDPSWGLEASTAFNHFYIARSLLEQAEHHLEIAAAYDRECWKKFREKQEADT